jgi:hypothetical protein
MLPGRREERTVRWVRLRDIEKWLACGWVLVPANAPIHHHDYAFLMEWLCDCPLPGTFADNKKELS